MYTKTCNDDFRRLTMFFEGTYYKSGRDWIIEIEQLDLMTQAKSQKDVFAMAKDAIEVLVDDETFSVTVEPFGKGKFFVHSNNAKALTALLLQRTRMKQEMSLRDVAKNMNSSSPNSFGRFEQGSSAPTVEQLEKLIPAISPELDFTIKLATVRKVGRR